MKKRFLSMLCMAALVCSILFAPGAEVSAAGNSPVDGSYLTTQDSSVGKAVLKTKGVYLMTGDCSISKAGTGRIYCYGSTTANMDVDYVGVIVYVERYNEDADNWDQIDCWTVEDTDTYYVSTSKTIKVDRGYYYRIWAEHIAGPEDGLKDEGISVSDGILIS